MDPTLLPAVQDLEAATNDAEAAQNARIEARLLEVHTCMTGAIVSYDPAKKTAVCKPGIKRIFRGDMGAVDLPNLVDCLVSFPSGGGFTLTFPLAPGDECELRFSERALDCWWQNGQGIGPNSAQPPAEYRMHDLSDCICQVGISSKPHVPPGLSTTAVELRANDGSSKVSMGQDGSVTVVSKSGKDVSVNAGGNANISGELVKLNADPTANPATNGVVSASCPCHFDGLPHAVGASTTVLVGGLAGPP